MKRKNIGIGLLFGMFLMIIIMISGCIGGGDEKQQTGEEQPPAGEETPGTPSEKEEPKTEETKGEAPGKSLADILNLGKPEGYTISYDMTGKEVKGEPKMTIYSAGDKMRIDTLLKDVEGTTESSTFMLGDEGYVCIKTEGEWLCLALPPEKIEQNKWEDVSDTFEKDPKKPLHDGTQNIAGVAAECYKLESEGMEYRYCLHSQKYIMLSMETYMGGVLEYKMIATEVDLNTPQDSVFELPAEPTDIERMMGGGDPCAICDMLPSEERQECLDNC